MFKVAGTLLTAFFLLFSTIPVFADQVTLKNGDRISGKVVEQGEEVIVLETPYAGTVRIAAGHVEKIVVGEPEKPVAEAKAKPKPAPVKMPETKKSARVEIKPVPRLFGGDRFFGIADGWSGNANIGFSYTSGNSRTTTMTTGIRAVKAGHSDNLTVYFRSLWNTNRKLANSTTSNAFWGGARYDRNLNDRVFGFGSYDFERDRPRKLNYRSVVGGGIGHHTVNNDRTQLDVLVGGAWNHTWQVGKNTDSPEALIGNSLKHRLNSRLKLQENFTFYQNITDKSEYRFILDSTLSADVTKKIGWFITVGNRFNNDPIGNSEKNDFLLTTGIKWNFGGKR